MPVPTPDLDAALAGAARRFAAYFDALRERFPEREHIIAQVELALLAREHVLIFGPPGTGKSELAAAAARGLVNEAGEPSVYSRQIVETTVQQDLLGPVDFKILTETGQTRYRTEEGLLARELAVIDEVFDARDLLLRSLFSVLNEREFAAGATTHRARLSTALFTTNRYLSELLSARPDTLLAFSDRVAFAGFVPKGFASPQARLAILRRAAASDAEFSPRLPLEDLEVLRRCASEVEVEDDALASLGSFANVLEHALQESSGERKMTPTRYISGRALAKGVIIWKAALARERVIYRKPGPLQVKNSDLGLLRPFFCLAAPASEGIEGLMSQTQDPRDQAQLKLAILEEQAFSRSLAELKNRIQQERNKEAADLGLTEIFRPDVVSDHVWAGSLAAKALQKARHPKHRDELRKLLHRSALGYLTQGSALVGDRGSQDRVNQLMGLISGLIDQREPELAARAAQAAQAEIRASFLAVPRVEAAEEFEPRKARTLADLVERAGGCLKQFERAERFLQNLSELTRSMESAEDVAAIEALAQSRKQAARAFRRRVGDIMTRPQGAGDWPALHNEAAPLSELDEVLSSLSPGSGQARESLITSRAAQLVRLDLATQPVARLHDLLGFVREQEKRLGNLEIDSAAVLRLLRLDISRRVSRWLETRALPARPREERCSEMGYLQLLGDCCAAADRADAGQLVLVVGAQGDAELAAVVRKLELLDIEEVGALVGYLDEWFRQVCSSVPPPGDIESLPQAEAAWAQVSSTRFFQITGKDNELVNLQERLRELSLLPEMAAKAAELTARLEGLARASDHFGRALLDRRAALSTAA